MALAVASFTANANYQTDLSVGKSVTVSWSAGDAVIVFLAVETDSRNLVAPTATGLTFSQLSLVDGASGLECAAGMWGAIAGASGSSVSVTGSSSGAAANGCITVWVISGGPSSLTAVTGNTTESTLSIACGAGDVVCYGLVDWNATNPPGKTPATGSGTATERADQGNGSNYGVYIADWVGTSSGTFGFGPNNYTSLKVAQAAVLVKAPSGTNYTKTPADAVGVTDARTVVQAIVRTPGDAVGVTDSAVADLVPGGGTNYTKTPADPVGVTDARSAARAVVRAVADVVGATDAVARAVAAARVPADLVGVVDSRAVVRAVARTQADSVGIVDSASRVVAAARTRADSVGITDSVSAVLSQLVANAVGVTDARVVVRTISRTVGDAIGVTDSASAVLSGGTNYTRTVADAISITDTGNPQTLDIVYGLADAVGVVDVRSVVRAAVRAVVDLVGITDSASSATTSGSSAIVANPVGITDSVTVVRTKVRLISDAAGVTDSRAIVRSKVRSIGELVGAADSAVAVVGAPAVSSQSLTLREKYWLAIYDRGHSVSVIEARG